MIQQSINNGCFYWKNYLKSLLFLQAIRLVVFLPVLSFLFVQILRVSTIQGITESTIMQVLTNPKAIPLLALLAVFALFFIFYELSYYFLLSYEQKKSTTIRVKSILKKLNQKFFYFLSYQLLLFILYFILILPIASVGLNAVLTENIRIPYFISDELLKSTLGTILYISVLLLVFFCSLKLIYTIPFFVIDSKKTIFQAMKQSWHHSSGKVSKSMLVLGGLLIGHGLFTTVSLLLLILPLILVEAFFLGIAPIVAGITFSVIQCFLFINYGFLQAFFTEAILALAELASNQNTKNELFPRLTMKKLAFIGGVSLIFMSIGNGLSLNQTIYQPNTLIIAHRGDKQKGVENTLASLKSAADLGVDYVEMDVQETKDHQFVVFHDRTLRRLANRPEAIFELTLAELQKIEVRDNGFTAQIPSFKEYLDAAKKAEIKLLVEIKLHGHESENLEKNFVQLLQDEGVSDEYLVQSLNDSVVKKVKQIEPTIKTGYLVALNVGNLPEIAADFLVLEEFSFTTTLLQQAREQEKTVFIWTVNRENLMKKYLRLDVDGMITNYSAQALQIRESFAEESSLTWRIRQLLQ